MEQPKQLMPYVNLSFLGTFQASINNEQITNFRSINVQALLVYLIMNKGLTLSRNELGNLLWPDDDDPLKNFRSILYLLRQLLSTSENEVPYLVVTNKHITFQADSDFDLDVDRFEKAAKDKNWEVAIQSYTGDFLAGFECESRAFMDWVGNQRRYFKGCLIQVYENHIDHLITSRELAIAINTGEKALLIEPWAENIYQKIMLAYALDGNRAAALAQYDRCFEALIKELGVEPSDETNQLYEQIASHQIVKDPTSLFKFNVPKRHTQFIGRTAETTYIIQRFNTPQSTLISLVGAGGSGKTRLAIEISEKYRDQTNLPAYFVPLTYVKTYDEFLKLLGQIFSFNLFQIETNIEQIADSIAKEVSNGLLIFDNAEALITEESERSKVIEILNLLLERIKELNILITSRIPLKSEQEWIVTIYGLPLPKTNIELALKNLFQYDGLKLFQSRARKTRPDFDVTSQNIGNVLELCHQLDGNPLGIELAAAQLRQFSVAEILARLRAGSSDLSTNLKELPKRHRSLKSVFFQSWSLLSPQEKEALSSISVFEGGFSRVAARQILGEHADFLESLVDHALLQRLFNLDKAKRPYYRLAPYLTLVLRIESPFNQQIAKKHADFFLTNAGQMSQQEVANNIANIKIARERASSWETFEYPEITNDVQSNLSDLQNSWLPKKNTLIGRDKELAELHNHLVPLRKGSNGGLVTIIGKAGIGKSYLVAALRNENQHLAWYELSCDETDNRSLHLFRSWLKDYFNQDISQSNLQNKSNFENLFLDLVQSIGHTSLIEQLQKEKSVLAALLGLFEAGSLFDGLQPQEKIEHYKQAIKVLIKAESLTRPVVLRVEDAHWIDSDSRATLEFLFREVSDFPFAVLLTARPDGFKRFSLKSIQHHSKVLVPFLPEDIATLAQTLLKTKPSASLLDLLTQKGEGNPFYTQQILLYLIENQLLKDGELVYSDSYDLRDSILPTDMKNLLASRLSLLEPEAREVVASAAVLGNEFPISVLSEMVTDKALNSGLSLGVEAAIWQPVSKDRYLFNHALLRESAYQSQFQSKRKELHRQAAEIISKIQTKEQSKSGSIARHFDEAGDYYQATLNYLKAADEACENYFIEEAHSYYSRGLELTQIRELRIQLLLGLEITNQWMGRTEQQQSNLRELEEIATQTGNRVLETEIELKWSTYALATSNYKLAISKAKNAKFLASSIHNQALEAEAYYRWGRGLWQQGKEHSAEPILNQALRLAQLSSNLNVQAICLYDLALLNISFGKYQEAKQDALTAIKIFEDFKDIRNVFRCKISLGRIYLIEGDYEVAIEVYQDIVEECQSISWQFGETYARIYLGNCFFEVGQFEECRLMHLQAFRIAQEINDLSAAAISLDVIGQSYYFEGNYTESKLYFEQALRIHEELDNPRGKAFILTHLGLQLVDMEEIELASIYLYDAISLRNESGINQLSVDTEIALAWLAAAEGDIEYSLNQIRTILPKLSTEGVDGIELPFQVYWLAISILRMAGEKAEADKVLIEASSQLKFKAEEFKSDSLRQSFLSQIPYNRQIIEAVKDL